MNPNPKVREKISNDLKIGQTVLRHMQNGDILLVNLNYAII